MAEKNEETRSVWDYMEHGVDFEGKETAGELLGAVTGELTQASANLWTANRKQEDLNREILERNESALDIDEFLAAEYQNEESKEYLVEGAVLTCTNSTREIREIWDKVRGKKIKWGVGMMPSEGGPDSMKMYRKLVVTSNQGADVNGLKNATIYDCVAEENIFGFGNCVRYPDSPEEEEKLMRYHDEMDSVMIREEGTCPQLMKLESEWENYIIDGEYQTFGDDNQSGITMTSMLFCKHGGLIYPVNSGQMKVVEVWMDEERKFIKDTLETLGWPIDNGELQEIKAILDDFGIVDKNSIMCFFTICVCESGAVGTYVGKLDRNGDTLVDEYGRAIVEDYPEGVKRKYSFEERGVSYIHITGKEIQKSCLQDLQEMGYYEKEGDIPDAPGYVKELREMPWAAAAWRWAVCPQTGDGNLNAYVTNRSAENGDELTKGVFLTAESFINGIVNDDTGLNDVLGDVARNRIVWEIKNERLLIGEQSYRTPNNWNQCEANYQKLVDRGMAAQ